MDATSNFRPLPNNFLAQLNLEQLGRKLVNAEALEKDGDRYVNFKGDNEVTLHIEDVWNRVFNLAKNDRVNWNEELEDLFVAVVKKLRGIEDEGFDNYRSRINGCIALFCCWFPCPSSEAAEMIELSKQLEWEREQPPLVARLVVRSSNGDERVLEEIPE